MTDVQPNQHRDDGPPEWWRDGSRPTWEDFAVAVALLTVVPLRPRAGVRIGRAALFYPVVGLALGGLWVAADQAAGMLLGIPPRAACMLALWLTMTGGRQLLGCLRTSAAVARNRQRALQVMSSKTLTALGVVGMLAAVAVQLRSLLWLRHLRGPALLFAPLLACWSVVVLAHGSRAARADGRQIKYAPEVRFREFAVTSAVTFGVLFSLTDAIGIVVGVCAGALLVALRVLFHWWLGGVTDAAVAAAAEITFTLVLALFTALEPAS